MKLIRIGNDIKIEWTITRYGEPEDFTGKNLSVGLYDKFNEKQTFDYIIDGNVIYGTFYGKDQTTNGVYRLYLTENEGEEDMVTLDYIDCFCISNKLKNQTSNGQDPSSINTEVVQLSSAINVGGTIVKSDWDDDDPHSPHYIQNKPELFSGDYDDLTNKPYIPTKTSDLTNDSNYVTASSLATVATSGNYNDLTNKPNLFSGNYNDLTNKPTIPTKTSDLTNDSNYVTASSLATVATSGNYNDLTNKPSLFSGNYNDLTNKPTIPTKTSDLTNDSGFVNLSIFSTVATSGDYNDLINKPTIPVVPTYVSAFTNDANYINQIKTINHMSLIGEGNINIGGGGTIVQADWAETDPLSDTYIQNKPLLATVATSGDYNDLTNKPSLFSGNYNDLTNKPTIPTKTSDLTNDSNYVTASSLATVATSGNYNDLLNKPTIPVIPTYVSAFTNDANYINQIKTINNQSLIGEGNINISGGSSVQSDWTQTDTTADDYIKNKPSLATVATSGNYNDLTNKPTIPTKTSDLTNDSNYVTASSLATVATSGNYNDLTNKPTIPTKTSDLNNDSGFVASTSLATVATSGDYDDLTNKPSLFSGNYNDLTNKPTIPTKTSDLTNDSGFVASTSLATVATSGNYNDLSNKPTIPVVPTYVSAFTNDANYVTASSLATVATSGNYNDLSNKPTIPVVPTYVSAFTNDANYLTQHQSLANCVQSTTTGMRIEVVSVMPVNPDQNTLYVVA